MKVVLLERVEKLGAIGDVVSVKDGFARNYLLPQSKALRATSNNLKVFEAQRSQIEARNADARARAERVGKELDGRDYLILRQAGEGGQLYGSVSARDIADAVNADGEHTIERGMVVLNTPIKTVGMHDIRVRLHPEVTITVKANVARTIDEANRQLHGEDVIASAFDADRAFAAEQAQDLVEGGAGSHEMDAGDRF
jgi:large subunit ribosomal protein L9